MEYSQIIQFVCFNTSIATPQFLSTWQSYAKEFLRQGIKHITLHESVDQDKYFRFISKNTWPKEAFLAAFDLIQSGPTRLSCIG